MQDVRRHHSHAAHRPTLLLANLQAGRLPKSLKKSSCRNAKTPPVPRYRVPNENAEIHQENQWEFSTPTYVLVEARTMAPKQVNMIPQGPPPPLSNVEIAALGGYVVTVKPRKYGPPANPYDWDSATPVGPTPSAIHGNYPLEYYNDRMPRLPACLDRRSLSASERQAA
jgi:hypothetical protein